LNIDAEALTVNSHQRQKRAAAAAFPQETNEASNDPHPKNDTEGSIDLKVSKRFTKQFHMCTVYNFKNIYIFELSRRCSEVELFENCNM
jgi:hypothetical protein